LFFTSFLSAFYFFFCNSSFIFSTHCEYSELSLILGIFEMGNYLQDFGILIGKIWLWPLGRPPAKTRNAELTGPATRRRPKKPSLPKGEDLESSREDVYLDATCQPSITIERKKILIGLRAVRSGTPPPPSSKLTPPRRN
jgi:hypothetical protein